MFFSNTGLAIPAKGLYVSSLQFHHVLNADFIHLAQVSVDYQSAVIGIFPAEVIGITRGIHRQLIGAAHESSFGIVHEGFSLCGIMPCQHIAAVCPRHNKVALSDPFGRKFTLVTDGDVAVLAGKNHVLTGGVNHCMASPVISIIFRMIKTVKKHQFVPGIMCLPPDGIIFVICFSVSGKTFVVHNGAKYCIGDSIGILSVPFWMICSNRKSVGNPLAVIPVFLSAVIFKTDFIIIPHVAHGIGESKGATVVKADDHAGGAGKVAP